MFQVLETKGSFRQVGRDIGEAFKRETSGWIKKLKELEPNYDRELEKVKQYIPISEDNLPDICDMVKGMAEGGGISYEESFFLSTGELVDPIYDPDPEHCTIAVSFTEKGAVIGHNEDFTIDVIDDLYILKANVNEMKVLALAYKSVLPGTSVSLNSKGLVQCINELHQTNLRIGIPKIFASCAVMFQDGLDEAEELIKKLPKASGFNHVLVNGDRVLNVEIAGQEVSVDNITNTPYVHTNHYLSKDLMKFEKYHSESSARRFSRAKELVHNNMTEQEMMSLLSDRQDEEFPISRPDATIGSVVIVPRNGEMFINYGPPTSDNYTKFLIKD